MRVMVSTMIIDAHEPQLKDDVSWRCAQAFGGSDRAKPTPRSAQAASSSSAAIRCGPTRTQLRIGRPVMSNSRTPGSERASARPSGPMRDEQLVLADADGEVAADREAERAEHLHLREALLAGERRAQPFRELAS